MKKERSWLRLIKLANFFRSSFKSILNKHNIDGKVIGSGSLLQIKIEGVKDLELKKYFASEMLKNNMLATNVIYLSVAHNKQLLKKYFKELDRKVILKLKRDFNL